jgi:hypothetical protein
LPVAVLGDPGNSNQGDGGPNAGAIAGGLVGLVAVLAAVVLLFLLKRRKGLVEELDEVQLGDAEGADSASIGSDDVFVSEYGFSDKAPSIGDEPDDSEDEFVAEDDVGDVDELTNGDDDGDGNGSGGENLASEDGLDLGE